MSTKSKSIKQNHTRKEFDFKKLFPLVLIAIFIVAYKYIFKSNLDLNGDNFNYINYARSILDGHGYASPYTPARLPTNHYPPGYSALLAFAMFFVGKDVILLKILNGFFFIGSILLLNKTFGKITGNLPLAFSVSALLLVNSGLLNWSTIVMSEMSYLFFSSLAIYFILKYYETEQKQFWQTKEFYLIVITVIITYYIRSIGIVLAVAFILFSLLQKKWKVSLSFIAGCSILYLPWIIRNNIHGLKGRYMGSIMAVNPWRPEEGQLNTFGAFLEKMTTNFYDTVIKGFLEVLFPFANFNEMAKTIVIILGTGVFLFTLFGAWRIKKYNIFILLYILGNIFVFLVWHSGNGSRYVWPLAPFIAYCFFHGIIETISLLAKNKQTLVQRTSIAVILLAFLFTPKLKSMHKLANADYPAAYKNYYNLAKSIKQANNKNLMVCCRKPGMFHYFSETFACNYAWSKEDKKVLSGMIKQNVDYVILEQLGYSSTVRYLYPVIKKHGDLFKNISHFKKPDTYLFQFNRKKAIEEMNGK